MPLIKTRVRISQTGLIRFITSMPSRLSAVRVGSEPARTASLRTKKNFPKLLKGNKKH